MKNEKRFSPMLKMATNITMEEVRSLYEFTIDDLKMQQINKEITTYLGLI